MNDRPLLLDNRGEIRCGQDITLSRFRPNQLLELGNLKFKKLDRVLSAGLLRLKGLEEFECRLEFQGIQYLPDAHIQTTTIRRSLRSPVVSEITVFAWYA